MREPIMTIRISMLTGLVLCLVGPAFAAPPGAPARPPRPPRAEAPAPPERMAEIQEREAELLHWLQQNDQHAYQRLTRLRDVDQRAYMMHLMRVARMMDRSEHDPELVERHRRIRTLEGEIEAIVREIRLTGNPGSKEARASVEALVEELFEERQAERRAALAAAEAKIESLRQEIELREQDRKKVIHEYVEQVLTEPVDL